MSTIILYRSKKFLISLGLIYLIIGLLLWVPQLWNHETYPKDFHRHFIINGFVLHFWLAHLTNNKSNQWIIYFFTILFVCSLFFIFSIHQKFSLYLALIQLIIVLIFSILNFSKSFFNLSIISGLVLWLYSIFCNILDPLATFTTLMYQPSLILLYIASIIKNIQNPIIEIKRCTYVSIFLTLITLALNLVIDEGQIHLTHLFFVSGIIFSFILMTTNLNPDIKSYKFLYLILALFILSASTRVSVYFLPHLFHSHLSYASIVLILALLIWVKKTRLNSHNQLIT